MTRTTPEDRQQTLESVRRLMTKRADKPLVALLKDVTGRPDTYHVTDADLVCRIGAFLQQVHEGDTKAVRTPKDVGHLLELLEAAWELEPSFRFCQLLGNVLEISTITCDDETLYCEFETWIKQRRERYAVTHVN